MPSTASEQAVSIEHTSSGRLHEVALVLPFILIFAVQLFHHQFWQDEVNAWGVDVASASLKQLFAFLHYEAHPSIWYLLLWPLSRLTPNPLAIKAVELPIGVAVYLWIALKSPFSRWEKLLIYSSYFVSFEYTVISRMYGFLLLLALIYAYKRVTRPADLFSLALVLGLMVNTDTMGILLSIAFVAEYVVYSVFRPYAFSAISRSRFWAAASIYAASLALYVYTSKPAAHITKLNTHEILRFPFRASRFGRALLSYLVLPWFPIGQGFPHRFWEPQVSDYLFTYILLLPCIVALLYAAFRRERNLLTLVGLFALSNIAFGHLVYFGRMRHFGMIFIAFLVALWIQRHQRGSIRPAAYILLGLSAVAGVQAAIAQWDHPFSNAETEARWIRQHNLQDMPLVGAYDWSAVSVAEFLHRPIYFLDCECTNTFLLLSDERDDFTWEQVPGRLVRAFTRIGKPEVLVMLTAPLTEEDVRILKDNNLSPTLLRSFLGAEVQGDGPFLYKVARPSPLNSETASESTRQTAKLQ